MKKILTITLLLLTTFAANAQDPYYPLSDKGTFEEMVRSVVILALIYLVTSFILYMIKLFLDSRLKNKMVEVGTSQEVVAQLIASNKDAKKTSLKWFCTLCGIAAGLGAIGYFHLTDIYALMVIAFCLAIGFLAHFFLLSRLSK
jgi:preprotein translocase subunit SecG